MPLRATPSRVRGTALAALVLGPAALVFSATAAHAAPGGPSTTLTIARVFGGGGNTGSDYKNDYVEVFNKSAAPINLGTYSLQYASSGGTIDATKTTPLSSVVLGPGQYYLLAGNANGGGTTNLPTPDQTNNAYALSSTNATVFLVSKTTTIASATDTAIVDLLGYGSTGSAEGTATAVLSNTTQATRKGNGCTDTDNNAADFVLGSAASSTTPARNSSTTPAPCLPVVGNPDPPVAVPEVPMAAVLPLLGLGAVGVVSGVRRRRTAGISAA